MPIYEYRCEKGHSFEVMQRMSDDPLAECTICGATVGRVFHPVAVHFKGKGFYTTDYGRGSASSDGQADSSTDSTGSKSDSKKSDSESKGGDEKKPSPKSATKD